MMRRAASLTCLPCGRRVGRYPGRRISGGHTNDVVSCSTSLGMSTSTGPGRPVPARWNASAITLGMSAGSVTRKLCLVMGMVMPQMSASWNASEPISVRVCCPVMATTGTESM